MHVENFDDLRKHRASIKGQPEDEPGTAATVMCKDNDFWMFHTPKIEDAEHEKTVPGDKLWLIMRHMAADPDHNFKPELGYKLSIGDTIKFGRVRYKVIMMHSYAEGYQEYSLLDRFQKK